MNVEPLPKLLISLTNTQFIKTIFVKHWLGSHYFALVTSEKSKKMMDSFTMDASTMKIITEKSQSGWRWVILILGCLMMIGSYYCFDIPAALKTQIDDYMGDPSDYEINFGLLYTLYAAPNVISCFHFFRCCLFWFLDFFFWLLWFSGYSTFFWWISSRCVSCSYTFYIDILLLLIWRIDFSVSLSFFISFSL
jgi:hypothetical protein